MTEADDSPGNKCLRAALGYEPGSYEWMFFVNLALKMAKPGPGRPRKGADRLITSDEAVSFDIMVQIMKETGEERPYKLARLAVATGKIPLSGSKESTAAGLVRLWKRIIDRTLAIIDK
jgi:hypothetical protein